MSVERSIRGGKVRYRVRWREGTCNRAQTFDRRKDAEAFETEIRRRKQTGGIVRLNSGRMTLADFAREWLHLYGKPNLEPVTLRSYADHWDKHVLPRLGAFRLCDLTVEAIARFRGDLSISGVGDAATRKSMVILQGVLERAVEWGYLASNPARLVKKPPQRRERAIIALVPTAVEEIRSHLLAADRLRDATLISVLAYAGLRPGEALALKWKHHRERTLLVEGAIALTDSGRLKETKNRRTRTVQLLAPLNADLHEWRLASGRPALDGLVFPAHDGRPWDDYDWRNWRRRQLGPAAELAGVDKLRPYDLRHSYASLLLWEGKSIVLVAAQMGNSPAVCAQTYAHVLEELEENDHRSAEAEIRAARDRAVPATYPDPARVR